MKKKIGLLAGLVAVLGLMGWKLASNKKEIDSKKVVTTEEKNIVVSAAYAGKQMPSGSLELVGTAEANQEVMVPAEASGPITGIYFKLGDFVKKGAVLARIDDKYKTLAVGQAQINYEKTKDDYERYQKMHEGDAVSETQMRDARIAFENAKIQLEQAKKQLSDTRITAPFSGYVTSKDIEMGAFVNIGTTIASITDISTLKIVINVSESDAYLIKEGQGVTITTSVYPDATYNGKIARISPKGDQAHTYPVEISIANSQQYPLKAGSYVQARIDRGNVEAVLAIPRNGIVSSVKNPSVYLIQPDNTVKLTNITVGKDLGDYIEVINGIKENDQIVVNGQINLMDGSRVQIAKAAP